MEVQDDGDEGSSSPRLGQLALPLDEIDRGILRVLVQDARTSVRTLAETLHISRTNAYSRLRRLTDDKVITAFRAVVSPEHAGLGTSAYVTLGIDQDSWRDVSASLRKVPYVEHVALLAGDHDVIALVRAPDNRALRTIVLDEIQGITGVRTTRTWLVFDEFDGPGTPWT